MPFSRFLRLLLPACFKYIRSTGTCMHTDRYPRPLVVSRSPSTLVRGNEWASETRLNNNNSSMTNRAPALSSPRVFHKEIERGELHCCHRVPWPLKVVVPDHKSVKSSSRISRKLRERKAAFERSHSAQFSCVILLTAPQHSCYFSHTLCSTEHVGTPKKRVDTSIKKK